jgi:predicted amidophosphoribosyltransferase
MARSFADGVARALGTVAPPLCLCCRAPLVRPPRGPALCARCSDEIERAPGQELHADGIDAGFAPLPYAGPGRRLVAALKFSRLLIAAELGAALISAGAPGQTLEGVIVPVPGAPIRSLRRGFDPAAELAIALAGCTGSTVSACLRRRDLRRQRGRPRRTRLAAPPAVVAGGPVPPAALLDDDVVTTGATIDACAGALRAAGSLRVCAVAIAAVPSRREAI